MTMFRNAIAYALTPGYKVSSELLSRRPARPCGASEIATDGFVSPCDHADGLVHRVGGVDLICWQTEERLLPSRVINEALAERVEDIERQQGFAPGARQRRDIKEQVVFELLPKSFVMHKRVFAAFVEGRYFIVDTSSAGRAEDLLSSMRVALDSMPLRLLRPKVSATSAMTNWVASGDAPDGFTVDRDCDLRSRGEEKAMVRYVHHDLDGTDVRGHIDSGKVATKLAMTWNDRVSFVFTETLAIKKISYLDILMDADIKAAEDSASLFDVEVTISLGEIGRILDGLISALGGEADDDKDLASGGVA